MAGSPDTTSPHITHDDPVLIVGAGVFGLSLAHELARHRGYTNVTVLDRALPPVPDGSSVDISRIIRSEYADPLYTRMAKEAIAEWRRDVTGEKEGGGGGGAEEEGGYAPWYDESGFVIIAEGDHHPYTAKALEEGRRDGSGAERQDPGGSRAEGFTADQTDRRVKELYPACQARMEGYSAVHNPDGGWADAAGAIAELARRASRAGVSFVTGPRGTVERLKKRRVVGVETLSGETLLASKVVLAAGAWTNYLIPGVEHAFLATGQPVAFVQLTAEEAATLRPRHPVIVNMSTGVFCFPPSKDNVLKVARHGYGFATTVARPKEQDQHKAQEESAQKRAISSPRRDADNSASGYLPDDADAALREGFRQFFPAFADRAWSKRRMCWYTDTAKGDFVVDNHPDVEGVFFATGGSGHGFKFLPVLGKYIADCFEDKASPDIRQKWRLQPAPKGESGIALSMGGDGSRAGPPLRTLTRDEQAKL
ncbi:FAD dependent oxidoreductase [Microdochium bolleyi]|uniref:FAD dependent oxidoreductase n=1 Tax=Microdochium bolleyi TaxID=196109 RepID=A0A136J834_9PEZI|nr:FAD dependent oxidoreductase [Microdochium bolleyi]